MSASQEAGDRRHIQVTDPAAWRQLAHPTRRALLNALQHRASARAADLAAEVDAAPNAVSFHLRKLAEHGFVEQTDSPTGDAREKWWRTTAPGGFGADPEQLAALPGGERAFEEVRDALAADTHEFIAAWFASAEPTSAGADEPSEELRLNFDLQFEFTPAEYEEFRSQLRDVLMTWSERTRGHGDGNRRTLRLIGYGRELPAR